MATHIPEFLAFQEAQRKAPFFEEDVFWILTLRRRRRFCIFRTSIYRGYHLEFPLGV